MRTDEQKKKGRSALRRHLGLAFLIWAALVLTLGGIGWLVGGYWPAWIGWMLACGLLQPALKMWMWHRRLYEPGSLIDVRYRELNANIWVRARYLKRTTASHHRVEVVHDPLGLWEPGYEMTLGDDDHLILVEEAG